MSELKFGLVGVSPFQISNQYIGDRKCSMCGLKVKRNSDIPLLTTNPTRSRRYRDSYNVCPYCLDVLHDEMQTKYWKIFGKRQKPKMIKNWKKEKIIQTLKK